MSKWRSIMGEIISHIGDFHPRSRADTEDFFRWLPDTFTALATGINQAAANMERSGFVHPDVIKATSSLADDLSSAVHAADTVYSEHLQQHQIWLG